MKFLPISWWAIVALSMPVLAQQTWKVNCLGGPGVHFTDLPPAVAAAAPGDTILVYYFEQPACPPGFRYTAPTINKALSILGMSLYSAPPPPTSLPTQPSTAALNGVIQVTGIPPGQRVTISNLAIDLAPTSSVPAGLLVTDCAGSVHLEGLVLWSGGFAGMTVRIIRSPFVFLRNAYIRYGGEAVRIEDSHVLITSSIVDSLLPFPYSIPGFLQPYAQVQSPALRLVRSDVTVIASGIWGYSSNCNWYVQPGVEMWSSTLRIGPASLVLGCYNSLTQGYAPAWDPWTGTPTLNTVRLDPRYSQVVTTTAPSPISTWIHSTFHSSLVAGYPFGVTVSGPPDGFALLVLGEHTPTPIPLPFGALACDPNTAMLVDVVHLPLPGGHRSWTLQCPASAPVGFPFVFQALTLSTAGDLGLTVPSPLTVAWPQGVNP